MLPDRALYSPTFSHLLIVNKLLSLSHWDPHLPVALSPSPWPLPPHWFPRGTVQVEEMRSRVTTSTLRTLLRKSHASIPSHVQAGAPTRLPSMSRRSGFFLMAAAVLFIVFLFSPPAAPSPLPARQRAAPGFAVPVPRQFPLAIRCCVRRMPRSVRWHAHSSGWRQPSASTPTALCENSVSTSCKHAPAASILTPAARHECTLRTSIQTSSYRHYVSQVDALEYRSS